MISAFRCSLFLLGYFLVVQGERIAEQKCSEYQKLSTKKTVIIPLTVKPKPVSFAGSDCSETVDLIVGGEAAKPGEFPHQALLGYPDADGPEGYRFDCGGSLISERFILTAAHCFVNGYPTIVRLGEHNLRNEWDDQVDFEIQSIKKYPDYRHRLAYHDIALIELSTEVRFSKLIRPACLWTGSTIDVPSVIATGFGLNETAGEKADVLQKVQLDFLDHAVCEKAFTSERKFSRGVLDSQLCIGSTRGGKDTCQGDSGGPVQVITEPKGCTYHILGVTSTSLGGCGLGNSAAIYTKVFSYIDWIEDVVWGVKPDDGAIRFLDDD
ncbi:serine protease snake-like [Culex pipiens pallens]|uniref:serine protease snake-like n=1 Tax=Culex pipiens pallens TaxID=42434 RepID=UPI001953FFE5|nr:serine protease snake-like [Culex pipiens pallens]